MEWNRRRFFFSRNSPHDFFFRSSNFPIFFATFLWLIVLIELICPHFFVGTRLPPDISHRYVSRVTVQRYKCFFCFSSHFFVFVVAGAWRLRYFPLFILQSSERDRSWEFTLAVECSEGIFYGCARSVARQKNKWRCSAMALPQSSIDRPHSQSTTNKYTNVRKHNRFIAIDYLRSKYTSCPMPIPLQCSVANQAMLSIACNVQ